jgi:hypothetical protein
MGNSDRFVRSQLPVGGEALSPVSLKRVDAQSSQTVQPLQAKIEHSDSREAPLQAPERWDGLS